MPKKNFLNPIALRHGARTNRQLRASSAMTIFPSARERAGERIAQGVAAITDISEFESFPPDTEISLGLVALGALAEEAKKSKDSERQAFVAEATAVLERRKAKVSHALRCNTGRLIEPVRPGAPWVPYTRG